MSVRASSAVLRDVVRCADPWRTAARLERFHCHSPVLLLFDESEDEARRGGYGRTRAAAAARRHLRALRHADGLAAGHRVRVAVPARQGLPDAQELLRQGHGGRQEGQEGQKPTTRSPPPPPSSSSPSPSPSSSRWCRNQAAQDAVDVVHRLNDVHVVHHLDDVHVIDGHDGVTDVDGSGRNKQSVRRVGEVGGGGVTYYTRRSVHWSAAPLNEGFGGRGEGRAAAGEPAPRGGAAATGGAEERASVWRRRPIRRVPLPALSPRARDTETERTLPRGRCRRGRGAEGAAAPAFLILPSSVAAAPHFRRLPPPPPPPHRPHVRRPRVLSPTWRVLRAVTVRPCLQCVAGRLGLPALAADARVEGVDAVAASVVAAGPLAGAALSLVLEALLPYPLALLSRARRRASSSAAAAGPT
ncbi:hypothetical protein ONE63_010110 [Megalurothrips usitatus]|uniref:Uncharacterized protein n=1 Tax=Megalurothrips usitatus TaxID=439358 RepID=A0AAV7XPC9_9NEOP|nr:hypothetical protein ONE63_010110 [Megalurothrips usitatus]